MAGYGRFGTYGRFGGFAPLHGGTQFSNVAHINDAHISRGVSTVGPGRFGVGGTTAVAATHEQLSSARMMTGNLPVVPTRASLSASGRAAAASTIHSGAAQHFYGTQSTSRPESFQQQTAHLQQSMQQSHFSPVTAGRSGGGMESRSASSSATAGGKPSAGTAASTRDAVNSAGRSASDSGASARGEANRSEWKTFTPPSHSNASVGRSGGGAETASRGESGSYWNRTAPGSGYSRAGSSAYGGGGYSRPQLNMRQPIVQPRSSGGYGSGGYGGYRGSPSYGGSHGAPSGGGGHAGGGGGGGHSGGGGHR